MRVRDLHSIIRAIQPLTPEDSVVRAVRLLRVRRVSALPVASAGRLIGVVGEEDVSALASAEPDPQSAARRMRVSDVMRPVSIAVPAEEEIGTVITALHNAQATAAPVVAANGQYLGMVLRQDLLAALLGGPAAPPIAGLATPFGVHLTTGALRAGANDLALTATGAALMVINLAATGVVLGVLELAERGLSLMGFSGGVRVATAGIGGAAVVYVLQVVMFLVLLRLSPLTGVHAAEHMVVHAIEEGEDLRLEKVRAMSRVHPRCGTNLMALLILLLIGEQLLFSVNAGVNEATRLVALFVLVMIILVTWRRLGAGMQRWVTTRGPSDRQLTRAVEVGQTLLAKVGNHPSAAAGTVRRLWNTGFAQVVAGFVVVALAADHAESWLIQVWSRLVG